MGEMHEMSENNNQENENIMAFRDFYPVNPPFGFVGIEINDEQRSLKYHTVEPKLTEEEEEMLDRIKSLLIDRMNVPLDVLRDPDKMESYLRGDIQKLFTRFQREIPKESEDKFLYYLKRDFLGYGKIDLSRTSHVTASIRPSMYGTETMSPSPRISSTTRRMSWTRQLSGSPTVLVAR